MLRIYLLHKRECEDFYSQGSFEELLLDVSLANRLLEQGEELVETVEEGGFQIVHQNVS